MPENSDLWLTERHAKNLLHWRVFDVSSGIRRRIRQSRFILKPRVARNELPWVFRRNCINPAVGCIIPKAVLVVGDTVFVMQPTMGLDRYIFDTQGGPLRGHSWAS